MSSSASSSSSTVAITNRASSKKWLSRQYTKSKYLLYYGIPLFGGFILISILFQGRTFVRVNNPNSNNSNDNVNVDVDINKKLYSCYKKMLNYVKPSDIKFLIPDSGSNPVVCRIIYQHKDAFLQVMMMMMMMTIHLVMSIV